MVVLEAAMINWTVPKHRLWQDLAESGDIIWKTPVPRNTGFRGTETSVHISTGCGEGCGETEEGRKCLSLFQPPCREETSYEIKQWQLPEQNHLIEGVLGNSAAHVPCAPKLEKSVIDNWSANANTIAYALNQCSKILTLYVKAPLQILSSFVLEEDLTFRPLGSHLATVVSPTEEEERPHERDLGNKEDLTSTQY